MISDHMTVTAKSDTTVSDLTVTNTNQKLDILQLE